MFNRVEVWGVWREEFEGMPRVSDHGLGVRSFMKRGIVHDHHRSGREFGDKIMLKPQIEDIRVDIPISQSNSEQNPRKERAQHIHPPTRMPILRAKATLAAWRIAVCARHVASKTALVKINNSAPRLRIAFNLSLEDAPFAFVRLWMFECFFYM